jgi:hypothetical protein
MKYGVNTFDFTSSFRTQTYNLVDKIISLGFDVVEFFKNNTGNKLNRIFPN